MAKLTTASKRKAPTKSKKHAGQPMPMKGTARPNMNGC